MPDWSRSCQTRCESPYTYLCAIMDIDILPKVEMQPCLVCRVSCTSVHHHVHLYSKSK